MPDIMQIFCQGEGGGMEAFNYSIINKAANTVAGNEN